MITVGYGDVCPITTQERMFVILTSLLGCGVFAYSINAIGSIISDITKSQSEYKAKMAALTLHMKKRGLSNTM